MNHEVNHKHEFVKWIFKQHRSINHFYDSSGPVPLPYEFHLALTANVLNKEEIDWRSILSFLAENGISPSELQKALYAHDVLEDVPSRVSYNDLLKAPGIGSNGDNKTTVADLVFAVSNNTGKNRKERADAAYYAKIRNNIGAAVIKMCDRIANVEYGILTNNLGKRKMYKEEYPDFKKQIYLPQYDSLFVYLENKTAHF